MTNQQNVTKSHRNWLDRVFLFGKRHITELTDNLARSPHPNKCMIIMIKLALHFLNLLTRHWAKNWPPACSPVHFILKQLPWFFCVYIVWAEKPFHLLLSNLIPAEVAREKLSGIT